MVREWSSVSLLPPENFGLASNDYLDQRLEQINSFKDGLSRFARVARERHFRFQSVKEFLCMGDIADAVHVRIFLLHRALPLSQFRQIGHEPLDEAFEESHHDDDRNRREASDE